MLNDEIKKINIDLKNFSRQKRKEKE